MSALRVMTYNVRYFGHATRGIGSTGRAMSSIARAIAALDPLPDVICLQELETASVRANWAHWRKSPEDTQLSRLMAALHGELEAAGKRDRFTANYFPAHTYKLTKRTNFYTTGLAVLTHNDHVIVQHNADQPHDITHRRNQNGTLKQTRICAHVRLATRGGQTLDVFNAHLSLPAAWTREFWTGRERMGFGPNQLSEAVNLLRAVREQAAGPAFIMVGDFNALPGSPVHRFLREEGFHDAFRAMVCQGDDEAAKRWPTAGFLNLRFHLDHIFSGPGLRWLDFDDSAPFGTKGARFHGLSDHVPLIARCSLGPTR